jgi:oligopeptide/dipeptide ABC transporter ATP-binding protein
MSSLREHSTSDENVDALIRAEDVKKHFTIETGLLSRLTGENQSVHAVDGVSLSINAQETVGLVGESGCGKSTFGQTLARLHRPTAGRIQFKGQDITKASGKELKALREDIQVVFQDPLSSLNPRKTIGEIVAKPLQVHDIAEGEQKDNRVAELFEEVGLDPSFVDRYPHELSGGQQQRIGLARALAVEPQLIIADEPVSALDVSVQAQIINLMKRLQDEHHLSYLFIAHDLSVVKHVSDRVAVMYLGKIVEQGPTEAIFDYPQHPYTRALLQAIPSVESETKRRAILTGNPPSPIDPPTGCPFHPRCPEYLGDECELEPPDLQSVANAGGTISPPSDTIAQEEGSNMDTDRHVAACHWLNYDSEERRQNDPLS